MCIKGAARAIDFYKKAFGAKERYRLDGPDGKGVAHAELTIGDSIIMLAEEMPQSDVKSPGSLNATTVNLALYVRDVDASFKQAVDAGAKVIRPVADQFYGDRAGCIRDPFGHHWSLMTHKEDLTPQEIKNRLPAEFAKMSQKKP